MLFLFFCFRRSSRDRSRSTSPRFDKAKLLSIARQNLEKMKSAGILPENVTQNEVWRTIQAGGKTVKDLTGKVFCEFKRYFVDFFKELNENGVLEEILSRIRIDS